MKHPHLIIIAGAGVSAPSGAGTFRDKDGLWSKFDPDKVCDISTYRQNYEDHHAFYNARRKLNGQIKPNSAHFQIAQWQERYRARVKIMTTNVDDLFERAGCSDVLHIHGLITEMIYNVGLQNERIENVGNTEFDAIEHKARTNEWCKPNVRLFGEAVPEYEDMGNIIYNAKHHDLMLVIGCSNVVIPFDAHAASCSAYSVQVNKHAGSRQSFDKNVVGCASIEVPELDGFVTKWMEG